MKMSTYCLTLLLLMGCTERAQPLPIPKAAPYYYHQVPSHSTDIDQKLKKMQEEVRTLRDRTQTIGKRLSK